MRIGTIFQKEFYNFNMSAVSCCKQGCLAGVVHSGNISAFIKQEFADIVMAFSRMYIKRCSVCIRSIDIGTAFDLPCNYFNGQSRDMQSCRFLSAARCRIGFALGEHFFKLLDYRFAPVTGVI